MRWIEKEKPTPFDDQPISGLFFLDGDLIANTQEPGLTKDWAEEFRGLKYPVVVFPSGAQASIVADAAQHISVCFLRDMRLPVYDIRDLAYERALALAEPEQAVHNVGEDKLELQLGYPHDEYLLVTYDNQQGLMTNVEFVQKPAPLTTEEILYFKEQLLNFWRQLPSEHQASIVLLLTNEVLTGQWGTWLREAIALRWPIETPEQSVLRFGISREDLKQVHLSEQEISQLTDEDLKTIAYLMAEHYLNDVFWDDLSYIAEGILAKKRQP
jgi:hypothetical protein